MAVPEHPRYKAHGIPANHINMPKVISKEDEGYRYLLEAIKQAYDCERSGAQDAEQNESHLLSFFDQMFITRRIKP